MVDQRHTLPNLKYLLTVLTAGRGEMPVRKKGGARILENGGIGEQRGASEQRQGTEKSPLINVEQHSSDHKRLADITQST